MIRTTLAITALFATLSLPAVSAEPSEAFTSCMDATSSTAGMLDCIGTENERVDGAMNSLWTEQFPSLSETMKTDLRASQRAWIAYRDTTCDFSASLYEGGSFAGVAYSDCVRQITTDRLEWLSGIFGELANR